MPPLEMISDFWTFQSSSAILRQISRNLVVDIKADGSTKSRKKREEDSFYSCQRSEHHLILKLLQLNQPDTFLFPAE